MAESAGDKDSRWYFTAEQLQNSPSRKCGIDADKELVYRQQTAYLIQEMGQALRVSQLCINTAIVYMHRFYAFHSFSHFNRHRIAAASLFLAAKVEEQPRKLEHVIRVAFTCLNIEAPDPSKETFAEQAQDLVFNENVLLQTLGFDVAIDHPHTHVVKTCHLVKACKDLAQTSYFMASNSLHLTTMCLQYKPTVVACFCIHLACRWSNWDIPHSSEGLPWFHYVDKSVTKELLTQLTEEFIQIYDKSPSRLKNKLNSIKTLAQSAKTDEGQRSGSSQERVNHHRASSSMSHHSKQPVDAKGSVASSSRQQHYQQMHHQNKSRDRPVVPPAKTAVQSASGHRSLPPPRGAAETFPPRESGSSKSRVSFPHHPAGFPHSKQPEYRQKEVASSSGQSKSGQYQQSGYFGDPTRSHTASQGVRYSQNSGHKHGDQAFGHGKNSQQNAGGEEMPQNSEGGESLSPRHPQKSIFSPDQPEVVKKVPPPAPRFDERRAEVKKEKRETPKVAPVEKKVASVKPLLKHPPFGQPYKASVQGKRSFDEMTRHEESGIDFREAKMRRSEAENESRARGKMESTMNPLNLGGSFNAFDATFDQPKSHKFPPSLVNSIETNPDLVSCLLKESLSENKYGSALNAMAEKPVEPVMETQQIPPPPVVAPLPAVAAPDGDAQHHKTKSEKKKKKEKHKHKEKDKSKDREERKRHKREKAREGDEGAPKNPVTLKITLPPREKAAPQGEGALDGGFKIKIPKDRIRADLNPQHEGPGCLPMVDAMEKPSSSLKIKISKDKIENFSDATAFGGKKKDKDKEKLMRTFQ